MSKDRSSFMKPVEISEKLSGLARAEKVFITAFVVSMIGASALMIQVFEGLRSIIPNATLGSLWMIPIWELFKIIVLTGVILVNIAALIEYLAIGFVFRRKIEIMPKEE